jgi:deazaflavin-dependent oxidoreductase (nitroreductase family)
MANLKDRAAVVVTSLHRGLYRLLGGRLVGTGFGMPVVILVTTGRKTGKKRETVLTSPLVEGDTVVLIASYGGDDRHPAWYLNLRDQPDVELDVKGDRRPMRARVASPEEKAELWPRIVASYKGYDSYQRKTDRDIPVVILEPR